MSEAQRFKQRLQSLISKPSVSCARPELDMSNLDVIHVLAEWLETLGFKCNIEKIDEKKANLIAKLGEGKDGLVLAGHSDTVPFDESRWQSSPFSISERDNRLYGLGSCDMKGFFPVIIAAIEALELSKKKLNAPLYVVATADEESSMLGARTLLGHTKIDAKYAIIGEPTNLQPIRMHKGISMNRIKVTGLAGHSSNPALGKSALEAMHSIISEMLTIREQIQRDHQNPGFAVEFPTMNLGCIHGGDNPNRICGHCELDFDLRILPGMNLEAVFDSLQKDINDIADASQTDITLEEIFPPVPPFEQIKESEWVQFCEAISNAPSDAVAFATEAGFLQAMGMETIVMGPGSIDQAHQPNEYLALDQINPAIEIIKSAILSKCL
jgi:acetylornithine deacetylase